MSIPTTRVGELIINGGFEDAGAGGNDHFAFWIEGVDNPELCEPETEHFHTGTGAVNLATDGTDRSLITQYVEVVPGVSYTLDFWVRGDGSYYGEYRIYDVTNDTVMTAYTSVGTYAQTYTKVTRAVVAPAGCYQLYVRFRSPADDGGVMIVDDVSMYPKQPESMPVIVGFGDTYDDMEDLSTYFVDATLPVGGGKITSKHIKLPGGYSYDWGRTDIIPTVESQIITMKGEWIATDAATMAQKVMALNRLIGYRSKLWRKADDANIHWRWARCTGAEMTRSPRDTAHFAQITLTFETDSGPWNGRDRTQTWTMTSGAENFYIRNDGNAPVTNMIMTITGYGDDRSYISVYDEVYRNGEPEAGYTAWTWTGTLGATEELVIDSGKSTVQLDGVDAYSGFVLTDAWQRTQEFFYLEPGLTKVTVYVTSSGEGIEVEMSYYDGWY